MIKNLASLFHPLPQYTRNFIKEDFKLYKYLFIGLFLFLAIAVNYWLNFETTYVSSIKDFSRFFRFMAFYGSAYFGGVIITRISEKNWRYLKNYSFWILSLIGIILISANSAYRGAYDLAKSFVDLKSYIFVGRLLSEFKYVFTTLFPLLIVWWFIRKKNDSFFGLTTKDVFFKPYFLLLALMVPLIVLAAQNASFLETYPTFKSYGTEQHWGVPIGWLVAVYEFLYASAFLSVELLFRGFLVIGLARIMGKDVILPMVCVYAFLHFEKPMGEAISSIFGGYLLGIFAYYSKNIWGGVFIHVGVALLMEAAAALVKM